MGSNMTEAEIRALLDSREDDTIILHARRCIEAMPTLARMALDGIAALRKLAESERQRNELHAMVWLLSGERTASIGPPPCLPTTARVVIDAHGVRFVYIGEGLGRVRRAPFHGWLWEDSDGSPLGEGVTLEEALSGRKPTTS